MTELKFRIRQKIESGKIISATYTIYEIIRSSHFTVNRIKNIDLYTGIKDKNLKEIYDGDILQDEYGEKYQIMWNYSFGGFCAETLDGKKYHGFECDLDGISYLEIIGNVHESTDQTKYRN